MLSGNFVHLSKFVLRGSCILHDNSLVAAVYLFEEYYNVQMINRIVDLRIFVEVLIRTYL